MTNPELTAILRGFTREPIKIGRSGAEVSRFTRGGEVLYLKSSSDIADLRRECDVLTWMRGKLPVPDVLYWGERGSTAHLLTTAAHGVMSCGTDDTVTEPIGATILALADGLNTLQSVDIADCPFDATLDRKLEQALYNIEHDLVDMDDFEDGNDFDTPRDLHKWLCDNRPPEDLCFTHGDYCLPNVFIDGARAAGFIDVGRAGIADRYQDIALCVRSIGYNLRRKDSAPHVARLFDALGIEPNHAKIRYYILLDELF
ncbi:MAG: aminoglycoside 3'-phosphotransferase [Oscillospiraceae bacterium]|nr:aminoglycoside 3'-phosphotransferase [Oscillospiraceae bacterium]